VSPAPRLDVIGLEGLPEFEPGDDLVAALATTLRSAGAREGDVVVVTSKVVSKVEGRLVTGHDRAEAVAAETRRVVARRGDLVIAETRHGFVCANAGVDASNLAPGTIALLPLDPDASAERLRAGLRAALGSDLAVVITDTFGRPWRTGVVNVAIGCAGLPAAVDLRGRPDDRGRALEATIVALADEVAAASGLVMAKDARIPASLVRGVGRLDAADGRAADLIRPADEDLFRTTTIEAIRALSGHAGIGAGAMGRTAVLEAIVGCAAPWPAGAPARRFSVIEDPAAIEDAMRAEPGPTPGMLVIPWLAAPDEPAEPGWWFAAGAAVTALAIALSAAGLHVRWVDTVSDAVDASGSVEDSVALGVLACGAGPSVGYPERSEDEENERP
jgi:coenzyme F420-0:L-glutamate ligase/coenzyme F420-1:gamma-L-glutamate ligase